MVDAARRERRIGSQVLDSMDVRIERLSARHVILVAGIPWTRPLCRLITVVRSAVGTGGLGLGRTLWRF